MKVLPAHETLITMPHALDTQPGQSVSPPVGADNQAILQSVLCLLRTVEVCHFLCHPEIIGRIFIDRQPVIRHPD